MEQNKTSELSKLDKEIQNIQAKARSVHLDKQLFNNMVLDISDENPKDIDIKEKVGLLSSELFRFDFKYQQVLWYTFLKSLT